MVDATSDIRRQVEAIPDRLLELKGDRSTASFARFLNVGVSTLHNYENGRTPPIEFLLNVAARTGVSIEWLLTGAGEKYRRGSPGGGTSKRHRILVVDDKEYQRDSICNVLEAEGYEVYRAGSVAESTRRLEAEPYDIVITDLRMPEENDGLVLLKYIRERYPRLRTIIVTVHEATAPVAVEAIRSGASDYLVMSKSFPEDLRSAVSRATREIEEEESASGGTQETVFGGIIGRCPSVVEAVDVLKKAIAAPKTAVLIYGEPGTGKEFFAKMLHANDPHRRSHGFVPVNCGAMPEEVLPEELFGVGMRVGGHRERPGVFTVADGGTVFLDEIDKASLPVQVSLLRILDDGMFTRLGEIQPRRTDVRLVCATSVDLSVEATQGRFRRDLLTRLEVLTVRLPPLRERGEDLELLARRFVVGFAQEAGRKCRALSPEALAVLRERSWPDNVRGLQAAIKRAVLFSEGVTIDRDEIAKALEALGRAPDNHESIAKQSA